jgi:hypothetical protein
MYIVISVVIIMKAKLPRNAIIYKSETYNPKATARRIITLADI